MTHDDGPGVTELQLLQSVTDAARNLFGAAAASVFLIDPKTGELVFEAVSGEGEGHLPGTRFPPGTGIVGWVASSSQPMLIDDVGGAAQFARSAAESTGYVPRSIMAAPLIRDGECLGVIEILDSGSQRRGELQDVDLLGLLATQAAIGVELLARLRWPAGNGSGSAVPEAAVPAVLLRISSRMQAADKQTADVVTRLLATADELLGAPPGPAGTIRRTL
jgi:GAF domain-containing protein